MVGRLWALSETSRCLFLFSVAAEKYVPYWAFRIECNGGHNPNQSPSTDIAVFVPLSQSWIALTPKLVRIVSWINKCNEYDLMLKDLHLKPVSQSILFPLSYLPTHWSPLFWYPAGHWQVKDPLKLTHIWSDLQLWVLVAHSSISLAKR